MSRARNAVVILILCIIGGYSMMKKAGPMLTMPMNDELRDTVAGNPIRASRPGLNFGQTNDGELRDALANNAAENGGGAPQIGSGDGGIGGPPRGSGNGGFGPLGNNIGNNLPPDPPEELSPSGPEDEEEKPVCLQRSEGCYFYED